MTFTKQKSCSKCGDSFTCGAEKEQQCWCEQLPHISLPGNKDQDCLCPKCLWTLIQETNRAGGSGVEAISSATADGKQSLSAVDLPEDLGSI
jgi:Cysteine-rich CWC